MCIVQVISVATRIVLQQDDGLRTVSKAGNQESQTRIDRSEEEEDSEKFDSTTTQDKHQYLNKKGLLSSLNI